jgi:hypothetical protein
VISSYSRGSSGGGVVAMETPGTVRINEFFFPGWTVRVDGQPAEPRVAEPTGAIAVDVPAGEHRIDARFGDTPPRTAGAVVSGMMLLGVLALFFWPQRKENPEDPELQSNQR